jgi:autotransporter-associated beta strand protein
MNLASNPAVSNNFTVYGLMVSNPPSAVSISATNTLVIGNYIDLSQASQDLTINSPVYFGESQGVRRQLWTVASGRTLSLNNTVAGADALIIGGGGMVYLGGTNNYSGTTTINGSTLTVGGGGQLGGGSYAANLVNNGAFNFASSASQTISGNLAGSGSLTVSGSGQLLLSGTNSYTGPTSVTGGTLAVTGSGLSASTNFTVAGGALLDFSGLSATFALGGARTLSNSSVGALLAGNFNCTSGTLSLVSDGVNPCFIQTNGTLTLSSSTVIKVNNPGSLLGVGRHTIISAASGGRVTGSLPAVTITGTGSAGSTTLQTNSSGGLDLVVTSTTSTNATSLKASLGTGNLTLTWPGDHLGWVAQSNSLDLANPVDWFDILGSQLATNLIINLAPTSPKVFYRLRYPN